jgi:hypothetical protein
MRIQIEAVEIIVELDENVSLAGLFNPSFEIAGSEYRRICSGKRTNYYSRSSGTCCWERRRPRLLAGISHLEAERKAGNSPFDSKSGFDGQAGTPALPAARLASVAKG